MPKTGQKSRSTFVVLALLLIVLSAGVVVERVRLGTSKAATSVHYSVRINGGMPNVQNSGVPIVLTFTVRNTGSAIPNYAVQFDGLGHWVVDDVSSGSNPAIRAVGPGQGFAFGPLAAGVSMTVTMDLAPRDAGRPTLSMASYPNLDATTNHVAADRPIANGDATWTVLVNL
jgi:hypothetical protein